MFAQFGAQQTTGVVGIRVMTQTTRAETVIAEGILDVTIAMRTATFAQTNGFVTPSVREVRIVGALTSPSSTFRL